MKRIIFVLCLLVLFLPGFAAAQEKTKPATQYTKDHQAYLRTTLPFEDKKDFELAEKGLLKRPEQLEITNDQGQVVWELGGYDFLLDGKEYDSINPSLHRQATLNMK